MQSPYFRKIDQKTSQFGYVDQNDSLTIPYRFQYAFDFVNDYAVISEFDYFGLINKKGEIVIPVEYNTLYVLPNGKSIAKKDNQWYFLNENGSNISRLKYDNIKEISEKTSWVGICRTGLDWYLLDTNLKEFKINDVDYLIKIEHGIGIYSKNQNEGLFNIFGQKITNPLYYHLEILKNGSIFYRNGNKYGFLNNKGDKKCEKETNEMLDNYLIINDSIFFFNSDEQEYYINSNCDSIFNDSFEFEDYINLNYKIKYFDKNVKIIRNVDTLFTIEINGKIGMFNQFGKEIIPPIYDHISMEYNFLRMFVVLKNNKRGLYCLNQMILDTEYEQVQLNGSSFIIEKNKKRGACNLKGEIIIPIEFDFIGFDCNGLIMVDKYSNKKHKVGYYNKSGENVIPLIYEDGREFHEGLAAVKLNGKWGFINNKGDIAIPIEYDSVSSFMENRAIVKKGILYGVIDNRGREILKISYSNIGRFFDGIAIASINNQYGFINYDGKKITQFIYSKCENYFYRGYGLVFKNNDVKKINKYGDFIKE